MAKQLELNFDPKSAMIKEIEKDVPDFKKNGFKTRDEYLVACEFDRCARHMEQMKGGKK